MANYFFGPSPYLTQNTLSIIQNSNFELLKVYVGLRVEYVSVVSCFHQNRNASRNVSTSSVKFHETSSTWNSIEFQLRRDGHDEANSFRICFANAPHNTDTKCLDGEKFRAPLSDVFTSVAPKPLLSPTVEC